MLSSKKSAIQELVNIVEPRVICRWSIKTSYREFISMSAYCLFRLYLVSESYIACSFTLSYFVW